jgi:hypothetical protein
MKSKIALIVFSTIASFTLFAAPYASAASEATGYTISPVETEITVNKGSTQSVELSVQNPANTTVEVKAVINDFVASSDESGSPRLILNSNSQLPADNFESLVAPIGNITLGPLAKVYFPVTITVPLNANSGGYYGAVRFIPTNINQTGNVGLTASVGSIFLITVPGNLIEKLSLTQLSAADSSGNPSSFLTSGGVSVLTRLDNIGNIQLQPFGNIVIKNMFGHIVGTYQFNNSIPRANILPSSIRKFINPLTGHSWFGRYTVVETVAYQQGTGNYITTSATFYYFPVWFLILVVAVVALLAVGIYWLGYRRRAAAAPKRK